MFACFHYGRHRADLSQTGFQQKRAGSEIGAPLLPSKSGAVCGMRPLRPVAGICLHRRVIHAYLRRSFCYLILFPDNNRHIFQTVGPRCCAAIIPGGGAPIDREQAAPPYRGLHRLSLGIGISHESVIMNRRNTLRLLALMISGVLALKASANGFRLVDQDAFATARGEAFVATADNPSAIYYNPAGITQLEGNNVRAGLYGIYFDPSYSPPGTAPNHAHTYHSSDNLAAVPQLFYTYTPENLPLSFGLGVYSPYGGSMSWPQDTGFRAVALQSSLTYFTINPVVAFKVLPSLSIGGGVMVNYAKMDLEQGILRTQKPNTNFFRFNGNGWSVGYNLGLLWQPHEKVSIGASFRS